MQNFICQKIHDEAKITMRRWNSKSTWSKNTWGIQKQVLQAEKSKIYLKLCFLREFCLSKNVVWFNGSSYRKLIQKETKRSKWNQTDNVQNLWQNLFQNCEFSTKICNKGPNNNSFRQFQNLEMTILQRNRLLCKFHFVLGLIFFRCLQKN